MSVHYKNKCFRPFYCWVVVGFNTAIPIIFWADIHFSQGVEMGHSIFIRTPLWMALSFGKKIHGFTYG